MHAGRERAVIYCPLCERRTAERTELSYIANDGTTGHVPGIACAGCGYIAEDRDATPVPNGTRVELHGITPLEWMLAALRAAGRRPRRRP